MKKIVACLLLNSWIYGITSNHIHHYLWANYQQFNEQHDKAKKTYEKLLSQGSVYAYKGYVNLLFRTKGYEAIVQLIPELDPIFATDADMQMLFSQALAYTGNRAASDERILRLSTNEKNNQEVAFAAAQIYIQRKELENALTVINNFLNSSAQRPNNFIFHFLQAQIYQELNDTDKALKSVRKSLEMYPKFDKGWLLMAMLEEQTGNIDNAIKGYTHFIQTSKEPAQQIQQHLLQLLFQQKLTGQQNIQEEQKTLFAQALHHFNQKEYEKALTIVDKSLAQNAGDNQSRSLKIQILNGLKQYTKVTDLLKTWMSEDPQQELWYKALHMLCRTSFPLKQAIKLLQFIEKKQPHNQLPVLYLADLYLRSDNKSAALTYFKKALPLTQDRLLQTKLLFHIGLLYYDQKQFPLMKKTLEEGLALNTDFAPLLNLLAYYYASKENNTEQAQILISKALTKEPKNPHYLDTQARIWYKQKEYAKALTLLEQLAQSYPRDTTILRHFSKTLYQVGEHKKALATLTQTQSHVTQPQEKQKLEKLLKQWNKNLPQ